MNGRGKNNEKLRKWVKWAGGVIGTVLLALIVAFASGLGNKAAEGVGDSERGPISYSVEEQNNRCFSGTFLPEDAAEDVLGRKPPLDGEADLMKLDPAAAAVDRNLVQVAIQGESERKVTLTGIEFYAKGSSPPTGSAFYFPCGGPTVGRALEVDLDAVPPRITASSAEVGEMLGTYQGRFLSRPIRFPWTVSLTDPLLLHIVGTTNRCYCTWTAEISWVSGSKRGVIPVDNKGEGFRVINRGDLDSYRVEDGHWIRAE
jgi:hypothetical protein